MKACIVTVYNSENSGSYWQARALEAYLTSLGYEVSFLKRNRKNTSHTPKALLKKVAFALLHGHPKNARKAIVQYCTFARSAKVFPTVPACGADFDLCVLGSDTIWNLDMPYFIAQRAVYWGRCSEAKRTIAYAASVANTRAERIARYPELKDALNALDGVSVRDDYSAAVLREFTDRALPLVCDPTLLVDPSFYSQFAEKKKQEPFLLVYYFQKMPEALQQRVVRFAAERQLKIKLMGSAHVPGAQVLPFSPETFIHCFSGASFVVTNTFHGTIFTLNFEKPAVFHSSGKQKVRDLLVRFGAAHQDFADAEDPDALFLPDRLDYAQIRKRIEAFRADSQAVLLQMTKEVEPDGDEG